jgi:methionyl-tRNA formyltransferase
LRIVFFGSPDFALPSLEALAGAGHEVALVVSQPARPVGRHAAPQDPPVAATAKAMGLASWQPETLKGQEALARLAAAGADLFVVVAYGRILGPRTLEVPRLGALNVHGSILPRWRGASPVQAALLSGDAETGVSIMQMDAGMDTGAVWAEARTPIGDADDAASLAARLAAMGALLLVSTLPAVEARSRGPRPQAAEGATLCPKIRREDGRVPWEGAAAGVVRRERAFTPWPGVFAFRGGVRVKLGGLRAVPGAGTPGTVLDAADRVVVACGEGAVSIASLQAEGRRAFPAREFVNGERVKPGEVWT